MMKASHVKFCELVASGMDAPDAYREACSPGCKDFAAWKGAKRLSSNVQCMDEISRLRELANVSAGGAIATLRECQEFLTKVLRVPLGELDETHPIVSKLKRTKPWKDKGGDGEQLELFITEEITKPDPLKAIELLGKFGGWFVEDQNARQLNDGLQQMIDKL
jgi:hypothetical protein